jgi:hypothetical protein
MSEIESNPEKRIALFQRKEVRRAIHNNEWWFVIMDVITALTDSVNPKGYFTDMRRRDPQLAEALKGGGNLPPPLGLEFDTAGGRQMLQSWNNRDAQGFPQNKQAAHSGGKVAGNARRELETKSGRKVVTSENYLALTQAAKKAKRLKI